MSSRMKKTRMNDRQKKLTLNSSNQSIKKASSAILDYIKEHVPGASMDMLFDIKLCVEEAIRNAILHGNLEREELPVDISYHMDDNKIVISVEDRGDGFDLSKLPDPTHADNLYKESGRGVYIIHRLMDKVTYSKKGNLVIMEKRVQ